MIDGMKAEHEAPFAEPAPLELSDDMEYTEDGGLIISEGYEKEQHVNPLDSDHFKNLVEDMDERDLLALGTELRGAFDDDKQSRSEWEERYKDGMNLVNPDDPGTSGDESAKNGLSKVKHPMMAEAATQFSARAFPELIPATGPAKSKIMGKWDEEVQEQADRVQDYLNYQVLEEMTEFVPDTDRMLFQLPLTGHCFKKSWYDVNLGRVTSRFEPAEYVVVNYATTDLETCPRLTHIVRLTKNAFRKYVANGFYEDLETLDSTVSEEDTPVALEIEGREVTTDPDDAEVTLLEMHLELDLKGFESEDGVGYPYIVTIDRDSGRPVRISRNWEEDDEKKKKINYFTDYRFLPGLGYYGFGLYHMIGGLGRAATGILRALLDSAAYANLQGGFKLKGRMDGGEIGIAPGEFKDMDATTDDIRKTIMPLPFKEPSPTLFSLLGYIVDAGKSFATVTEIGDFNANAPVGTTLALIEQGSHVFSSIHKRLHFSMKKELRVIAYLNGQYLDDEYPYAVEQDDQFVRREDFDERVDVIPVSDPNIFSSSQRISQAQAALQMAQSAPQLHDMHAAYKAMYEAMRIPNYEEFLPDPAEAVRLDPIAENVSLLMGKPISAFPDQDHQAHMVVLDQWFNTLPPAAQQMQMQSYAAHRAQHMAYMYRAQMQSQLGAPLPPLPDFREKDAMIEEVDPQMDAQISEAIAVQLHQNPQLEMLGPPLEQPGGEQKDPAAEAAQIAYAAQQGKDKAAIEGIQAKVQADIQGKAIKAQAEGQAKVIAAQSAAQLKVQSHGVDQQIKQDAAQTDIINKAQDQQVDQALTEESANAQIMRDNAKALNDIETMREKALNDILLAQAKAEAEIDAKYQAADQAAVIRAYEAAQSAQDRADQASDQLLIDHGTETE